MREVVDFLSLPLSSDYKQVSLAGSLTLNIIQPPICQNEGNILSHINIANTQIKTVTLFKHLQMIF